MTQLGELGELYREQGYVSGVPVISKAEATNIAAYFDTLAVDVGRSSSEKDIQNWHFKDRRIWEAATDPRLLDVVEALLGPNLLLVNTRFICKFPDPEGRNFYTWHQDAPFWGIDPAIGCFCSVALDPSTRENGCLRVIPGSQNAGLVPHHRSARAEGNMLRMHQELPLDMIDEAKAVHLELAPGEMSVHDARIFHASEGNTSDTRRCVFICTFVPADVRQSEAFVEPGEISDYKYRDWKVVLVRGQDTGKHFQLEPKPFELAAAQ